MTRDRSAASVTERNKSDTKSSPAWDSCDELVRVEIQGNKFVISTSSSIERHHETGAQKPDETLRIGPEAIHPAG